MKIGVIGLRGAWSTEALSKQLSKKRVGGDIVEMNEISADLNAGVFSANGLDLLGFDAFIIKKMGKNYSPRLLDELDLLSFIEKKGVSLFSSPSRLRNMISRLSCTLRLQEANIPMPPTLITECPDAAFEWIKSQKEVVYKPLYSTKARGMKILNKENTSLEELNELFNSDNGMIYLQKIANLNGQDHGLVFLKGEYLGGYTRKGDGSSWNTTTRSGGKYEAYEPPKEIIELAQQAQTPFGLDFCSVDVAITEHGPIVFEVSAFGGYRGLYESSGIDASEHLSEFIIQKLNDS